MFTVIITDHRCAGEQKMFSVRLDESTMKNNTTHLFSAATEVLVIIFATDVRVGVIIDTM